ncbi:hypothetical protein BDN70DRAFT_932406 [Pholiota conissans]|uniref:LsmAD domain-containing protein n=1 Tax=Pholiota conissans TaxID=109636 RepID=A0A9P5Z470_9AGAR|nr:hypothetical protein BDN70DRAFT_932406 [Pholiota conissans]
MATAARQNKGPRKGPAEPTPARAANRTPAWGSGARASPTFSPAGAPGRPSPSQSPPNAQGPATQSFPPLAGGPAAAQQQNGATAPRPETQSAPRDKVLQALSGLTGTTVTLVTKSGQRLEGVVGPISAPSSSEGEGVSLKDVKDVNIVGAPIQETHFVSAGQIESYTSGPAGTRPSPNGDTFRTDTDISTGARKTPLRERDLQAWVPSGDAASSLAHGGLDDETFGPSTNGANGTGGKTSWDQFSVNEQLFGVRASFDEDVYTTKLDRSAPDFKEREKRAAKLASEILGTATNNPHIAEERGVIVDDSGVNEEDKYGAVVRGQNAYVPPGARRSGFAPNQPSAVSSPAVSSTTSPAVAAIATASSTANITTTLTAEVPKVAINGPDGASIPGLSPASSKAASPAPAAGNKPPADPLPAFRDFVKDEKQRLTQKRQALVKSDMDKRMADLVKFSQTFKLNKPIPEDLVPILAKDEERQRQITEKARLDAASAQARAIGPSTPTQASRGVTVKGVVPSSQIKAAAATPKPAVGATAATGKPPSQALAGKGGAGVAAAAASVKPAPNPAPAAKLPTSTSTTTGPKKISMVIQAIPPFRGGAKAATASPAAKSPAAGNGAPALAATSNRQVTNGSAANGAAPLNMNTNVANRSPQATPMSPNTLAAKQLNAHASSFRPNPKANAFTPVVPSPKNGPAPPSAALPTSAHASHSASPKPKGSDSPSGAPNPFFGTRLVKKSTLVHLKDDFNPFKHNKVVDASQVSAVWPYNGKRYSQMFPPLQHPPAPHGGQMMPPMPPPIPPPSYEEDSAAQAAAQQQQQHRGYVYAYPPYAYPPQHMMPGMAPPGPPGPYMQGPYMQMGPYPPGMPPPNAMYSPAMGQMPPPQAYMQPPPGAYPPPPNGAGPRPSMPPTPIPSHAHPYYHQSPQLQHAYPMMMPPPPNIPPPHGYEGGPAPPVPMGGHA